MFYCCDSFTKRRTSLHTKDRSEAEKLVFAANEATRQPAMNLEMAKIYLRHSDPAFSKRTWQYVMDTLATMKEGDTQERWDVAMRDHAFDSIRYRELIATSAEDFLDVMRRGTVSTNVFLRRLHNFAVAMGWVTAPIIPRPYWPRLKHRPKRAITLDEHEKIASREHNPQIDAYYRTLWFTGGSQTDIAHLQAEDINWQDKTITYFRAKTRLLAIVRFGKQAEALLHQLPAEGFLFPMLARMNEKHRAELFTRRLETVNISGVSLHSYRYAWAERAMAAGMPERFAQQALGHQSKAVHHAYAKKAIFIVPALEEYERSRNV
ncbi:MAG: Phage integrase family protein [Verrucomicrobiales bacterium]|nr:Phage integrase family protein [Verrucomicrobiales bacterium]